MSDLCAIVGESGSGKSSGIRNLNPQETFVINVANKPIPIKGSKQLYKPLIQDPETKKFTGNLYNTSNVEQISKIMKLVDKTMPQIKQIIIDDAQYLMAFEAMDRALEKGFDKFSQIAQHFYLVLKEAINLRDNLKVFVLCHSENVGDALNPKFKIKTQGKMIDNMITVEGLFTYVLFTERVQNEEGKMEYKFVTNSDGSNTAKTPMGCFEDYYIDNDLQFVIDKINEYNE